MTGAASPKRVLVVDDEAVIRLLAVETLTGADFEVIEATDTDQALAVLESGAVGLHLLFTDVNLPGAMDGLELAHHVHRSWTWIGILITSGRAVPTGQELPPGSRFLAKPYQQHHVVAHARTLTGA